MAVSNVKKVTHSDMCAGTAGLLKGFTAEQIDQVTRGYAKYEEQIGKEKRPENSNEILLIATPFHCRKISCVENAKVKLSDGSVTTVPKSYTVKDSIPNSFMEKLNEDVVNEAGKQIFGLLKDLMKINSSAA